MLSYRVIVVIDGERTIQVVTPFERAPDPGEVLALPDSGLVTVRHVIKAQRNGLAGVILAWAG